MNIIKISEINLVNFPYHVFRNQGHPTSIERLKKYVVERWSLICVIFPGKYFR